MVRGLKMKVIGYDILPNKNFINYGGQYVERDEVFRKADFVSIHIPLNDQTFHSIGTKEFELMKRTAFFINASRGAIVNEKDLYQSIKTNRIAGAAVDVFETEPPSESLLIKLDKVITTPHIAAFTHETFRRMDKESVAKLSKVFED